MIGLSGTRLHPFGFSGVGSSCIAIEWFIFPEKYKISIFKYGNVLENWTKAIP